MIVFVIDIHDVWAFEPKRHSPVRSNRYRPCPRSIADKGMQAQSGKVHVRRDLGSIEQSQNVPEFLHVLRVEPSRIIIFIQTLQAPMTEALDHWRALLWRYCIMQRSTLQVLDRPSRAQRMAQLYRAAAQAGTRGRGRGWLSREGDNPTKAAVDVAALQAEAHSWATRYRDVDVRLQQLNWSTDLAE